MESPPYFNVASETVRDVSDTYVIALMGSLPEHPMEHHTMPTVVPEGNEWPYEDEEPCIHLVESFVDDFMQLGKTMNKRHLNHLSRSLLHAIHTIFPPPDISGHSGEDPVLVKKLLAGEGFW